MGATKRKRSASAAAAAAHYIPGDLVHKILLRLPSRSVLRFRAVCKAWRDLFSDPKFVCEHHRLQPDLPLVSFLCDTREDLQPLDLRTGDFRSVVPFTGQLYVGSHGSCDGLLLLSYGATVYVCNPATYQSTCLGLRSYCSCLVAFYRHDPTGEYRALLYSGNGSARRYFTMVAGGEGGGDIGHDGRLLSEEDGTSVEHPSGATALIRGNLHWPPYRWSNNRILVLDTATEVFRWMRPPPVIREHMPVLEMEGELAVFCCDENVRVVELWLLQDYKKQIWVCKYRVELPALDISDLPYLDCEEYWLRFFMSEGRVAVVNPQQRLLLFDMNGNLLETLHRDGHLLKIMAYTLKESLVRHAFFDIQGDVNDSEMNNHLSSRGRKLW